MTKLFKKSSKNFIGEELHEFGSVCWSIDLDKWHNTKRYSMASSVRFSDCNRSITWDFNIFGKDNDPQERIRKIENAIASLVEFKENLILAIEQFES